MQKCKHLRRRQNAMSERRENVAHGSNLTAEKWSVLVGIVQTNTGHFVYGEIFVILCVKRKRQERYKTNYQRITKKKKGGQEHASDSNRKNYGRGSQRHLRTDRKPLEEQDDSAGVERHGRYKPHLVCPVQRQAGGVLPKRNRGWRHRTGFGQIHRQNLPHRLLPHRGRNHDHLQGITSNER